MEKPRPGFKSCFFHFLLYQLYFPNLSVLEQLPLYIGQLGDSAEFDLIWEGLAQGSTISLQVTQSWASLGWPHSHA